MGIKYMHTCDACSKEVQEMGNALVMGGQVIPVGWSRITVTYAAKRSELAEESTSILSMLAEKLKDRLGEIPMMQTADCDLCDECAPKLANFFHSIGSPLRVREGLGIG